MGLIKALVGATGGVLGDQWKEYFYCDALDADTIMVKGQKRTNKKRSSNKNGEENIISNGSAIAVADGQCMLIVEQGKVVEVCAEAGEFVWDNSTEPSIFAGKFGKGLIDSFKAIGRRFTFGGDTGKDQRVYYINTKELIGNKYGTASPVPFRVVDKNIGLDLDISIRCNGEYSYRVCNPILFYTNVCGNVEDQYTRYNLDSQLRSELLTALQPAFAKISAMGVRYSALPGYTSEIADALNEELSGKWRDLRGIEIASFGMNTVNASKEDEDMIKELQRRAVMRDPSMAAATLVGAQADAMKSAAANENGAMMGFMGLGMAQNAGGMNANSLYQMAQAQQQQPQNAPQQPSANTWTCFCGHQNTGNFCIECGAKKPDQVGWKCSCGAVNKGKFCPECGAKKPQNEPLYKCDKCGWEPADPKNPPRFCPECGDPFNDDDIK
ncbi:MAG: SPFH domain-containing protein [Clostridia bacterium]|nr:SPFH domain-containing protein [Clostridia bacterium]